MEKYFPLYGGKGNKRTIEKWGEKMDMLDLFISAFGLATLVMFLFCLFMIFYILFFEDDEDLKKTLILRYAIALVIFLVTTVLIHRLY